MKQILILLFCFLSLHVAGQTVHGTVWDAESGDPLPSVTVVNKTTQQSAYTNEKGEYTITANRGETIVFSFVGYKTVERTAISSSGLLSDLNVNLYRLDYRLEEFVFRQKYTPYQMDSINRRETYSRTLARQKSSAMSPVSFLAERLSKRSKRLFKFQQNFYEWEDQKFIDTRYSRELVQQMTGLTGDTLAHFMNENPMPFDYARTASELELKMWIREKYKLWRKQ